MITVLLSLHDVLEMNACKTGHICLSAYFKSTTARILMKFGMRIMQLEASSLSYREQCGPVGCNAV
jgi:hypothetical protein